VLTESELLFLSRTIARLKVIDVMESYGEIIIPLYHKLTASHTVLNRKEVESYDQSKAAGAALTAKDVKLSPNQSPAAGAAIGA